MAGDDIVARLRGHIAITTRLHYAKDGYPEPILVHGPSPICQEAADEIVMLRAQRDQARREVCELRTDIGFSRPIASHVVEFAASRGWDCFKEASDER